MAGTLGRYLILRCQDARFRRCTCPVMSRDSSLRGGCLCKKRRGGFLQALPCGDDEGALSGGHELADCTLCELAPGLGKVELERGVGEGDLDQRVE